MRSPFFSSSLIVIVPAWWRSAFVVGGRTRRVRSYALGRLRLQGQRQAWGHGLVPASRRRRSNQSVQTRRFKRWRESLPSRLPEWCHLPFTWHLVPRSSRVTSRNVVRRSAGLVTPSAVTRARARRRSGVCLTRTEEISGAIPRETTA